MVYKLVVNGQEEFFENYDVMIVRFAELAPLHAVTCYMRSRRGEWILKLIAV